jgi:hypothetical protein
MSHFKKFAKNLLDQVHAAIFNVVNSGGRKQKHVAA